MFWLLLFWVLAVALALAVLAQVGYVGKGREVPVVTSLRRLLEKEGEAETSENVTEGH